jgi:hypothetical protein
MKIEHRANFNALISGAIWGTILSLLILGSLRFISDPLLFKMVWYAGNMLALMLYPVTASLILRQRTGLWISACFFSLWGGAISFYVFALIRMVQSGDWNNLAINIAFVAFIGWKLIPFITHSYALESERESPKWNDMNDLSLLDFLLVRFPL